jgi:hypothetical protein
MRKGNAINHTNGANTKARSASGQQRRRRRHHTKKISTTFIR